MPDTYASFDELARRETAGVDFRIHVREGPTGIALLAPHGGGIEPGTSEIAHAAAGTEHSLYVFEGLKPSGNERLHVTSARFDEPRCLALLAGADRVVTIHGEGSDAETVFAGGLDSELSARVAEALASAGFRVDSHRTLAGRDPLNVCNRGRTSRGVQLELSRGLRRSMFANLRRAGRRSPSAVFHRFVGALRSALA